MDEKLKRQIKNYTRTAIHKIRVRGDTLAELKLLSEQYGNMSMDTVINGLLSDRDRLQIEHSHKAEERKQQGEALSKLIKLVQADKKQGVEITPEREAVLKEVMLALGLGIGVIDYPFIPDLKGRMAKAKRMYPHLAKRIYKKQLNEVEFSSGNERPVRLASPGRPRGAKDLKPRIRRKKLPLKVEVKA